MTSLERNRLFLANQDDAPTELCSPFQPFGSDRTEQNGLSFIHRWEEAVHLASVLDGYVNVCSSGLERL